MTSFGERLKQLMEDQSISQRDLAAALNISKSTVSGYVNSYREPDFKSLLEIASIFHVTTDYLVPTGTILTAEDRAEVQARWDEYNEAINQ